MFRSLTLKPKICNQELQNYYTKTMQDTIRKLSDKDNKERKIYKPKPWSLKDILFKNISNPPIEENYPDITSMIMPVACVLSISSVIFYFYRRK